MVRMTGFDWVVVAVLVVIILVCTYLVYKM